jgi:hypothetical protein
MRRARLDPRLRLQVPVCVMEFVPKLCHLDAQCRRYDGALCPRVSKAEIGRHPRPNEAIWVARSSELLTRSRIYRLLRQQITAFSRMFVMGRAGIEPATLGLKVITAEFGSYRVSSRRRVVARIRFGCSRLVERALVDPALTPTVVYDDTSEQTDEFRAGALALMTVASVDPVLTQNAVHGDSSAFTTALTSLRSGLTAAPIGARWF